MIKIIKINKCQQKKRKYRNYKPHFLPQAMSHMYIKIASKCYIYILAASGSLRSLRQPPSGLRPPGPLQLDFLKDMLFRLLNIL